MPRTRPRHIPDASELTVRRAGQSLAQQADEIRQAADDHLDAIQSIRDNSAAPNGGVFRSEADAIRAHEECHRGLGTLLDSLVNSPEGRHVDRSQIISAGMGRPVGEGNDATTRADRQVLAPEQRVADVMAADGHEPAEHLRLGPLLRGWLTGSWDGAAAEHRAVLSEGVQADGGLLVPAPLAAQVIDSARNASRCIQAGVRTVPMTSSTLLVPRLAGSLTPSWRAENQPISESDLHFDSVKFTARSLAVIVRASRELLEDGQDVDGTILADLGAQIALEVDRVILRGTGATNGDGKVVEPTGLRNATGVSVTPLAANGATPTWDTLIDQVQAIRSRNYEPNAFIENPRTETTLAKQRENGSTGPYLAPPDMLTGIPRLTTNQVPTNLTTGTAAGVTSELYAGQWDRLWYGLRTQLILTRLSERYADLGQVGFLAWMRADVQVVQPGAFDVRTGVKA